MRFNLDGIGLAPGVHLPFAHADFAAAGLTWPAMCD